MQAENLDDPNHPSNITCPFLGLHVTKSATEDEIIAACEYRILNIQPYADILDTVKSPVFDHTTSKDRLIWILRYMRDEAIEIIRKRKESETQKAQADIDAERKKAADELQLREKDRLDRAMIAAHVQEDLRISYAPDTSLGAFFRSELSKISPPENDTQVMFQAYYPLTQRLKHELEEAHRATASEKAAKESAEKQVAQLMTDVSVSRRTYDGEIHVIKYDMHLETIRVMFAEGRLDDLRKKTSESIDSFEKDANKLELAVEALKEASVKAAVVVKDLRLTCDAEREEKECLEDANEYLRTKIEGLRKRHATVFAELQERKEVSGQNEASTQVIEAKLEIVADEMEGEENDSGNKKRKYTLAFSDIQEDDEFKNTVETFVKSNLALSSAPKAFVSTTDIVAAFEKSQDCKKEDLGAKFFKELKRQIMLSFGSTAICTRIMIQQRKVNGYAGIAFQI